jgi:hypothetical protein
MGVSIHAPARGATGIVARIQREAKVSIHAPARGATRSTRVVAPLMLFRSTPLREGRPVAKAANNAADAVSHLDDDRGITEGILRQNAQITPKETSASRHRSAGAVSTHGVIGAAAFRPRCMPPSGLIKCSVHRACKFRRSALHPWTKPLARR